MELADFLDIQRAKKGLPPSRTVKVYPDLIKLTGSTEAGILLSYIVGCLSEGEDGWVLCSPAVLRKATAIDAQRQIAALRKIRAKRITEERVTGDPPQLYIRLDLIGLKELTRRMTLKSWKLKTGWGKADVKGINVTRSAVEFWWETPDRVASRVSLYQFHNEGVRSGLEHLACWVGKRQAPEVVQFVTDLMEEHREYVD